MFLYASIFLNSFLKTIDGKIIGKIDFVAFDPTEGKLVGLILKIGFVNKKLFVILPKDIFEAGDRAVMVKNPEVLEPLEEIIRAEKVYRAKINFFGMPAETKSGKKLGFIKDLLVDKESFFIHRFYLQDGKQELVFPREQAIGVNNRRLIFKNEVLDKIIKTQNQNPELKLSPIPA